MCGATPICCRARDRDGPARPWHSCACARTLWSTILVRLLAIQVNLFSSTVPTYIDTLGLIGGSRSKCLLGTLTDWLGRYQCRVTRPIHFSNFFCLFSHKKNCNSEWIEGMQLYKYFRKWDCDISFSLLIYAICTYYDWKMKSEKKKLIKKMAIFLRFFGTFVIPAF